LEAKVRQGVEIILFGMKIVSWDDCCAWVLKKGVVLWQNCLPLNYHQFFAILPMFRNTVAILHMLRLPNLLIVGLTLFVPYWLVLRPVIAKAGGIAVLSEHTFTLLLIATMLTTLAGYVINDYFDRDIDAINRPKWVVVGRLIPSGGALIFYWVLQIGITIVAWFLYRDLRGPHGNWVLWLFPAVSFLLFLYAWQIKCTPIMGNMLVALLCGIVPLLVLVPEDRPLWLASFRDPDAVQQAIGTIWIYALFGFITNLFREQIKDLEDLPGDSACGCSTLAVVRGTRYAQKNAGVTGLSMCILLIFLLIYWRQTGVADLKVMAGVVLLLFPAVLSTFWVAGAKETKHFTWASVAVKAVMLSGLFLLLKY
jgi:4-hydroxybenzoate polyprenyltransferase